MAPGRLGLWLQVSTENTASGDAPVMLQGLGEHLHLPEVGPTSEGSNLAAQRHFNVRAGKTGLRAGLANFWDVMPDGLRYSRCHNNRNRVHSKCDVLESSRNQLPPLPTLPSVEKLSSTKPVPGDQKIGGQSTAFIRKAAAGDRSCLYCPEILAAVKKCAT